MRVIFVSVFAIVLGASVFAQSPTGSIGGIVFDPDAKTVPGAEIIVVNDLTRVQYETKTNEIGLYTVPNLPPGPYRVQASKVGFKTIIKPDIILNVQGSVTVNFILPVGAMSIAVTVEGGASMVNTTDAAVSTVVDHTFVENMPLNGRSFQDLILLTPGIVTNSPQTTGGIGANGEFSVNGQRTDANYYSVDGVSANVGVFPGAPQFASMSGSLPVSTSLGTTQGLVSVDALQEFRVLSSTYSAEYGRNPGGQFSFVTRSGTNDWHGTASEYLRNDVFDANNWFNNYYGIQRTALRQNDFGGTLGGPARIPALYSGKNKAFFFFSYEGLRLTQPQEAIVSYVPTVALRSSTPAALQPVLNAFPLPSCPAGAANCSTDLGNGLGEIAAGWSNPSRINVYGIRFDEALGDRTRLFFRFSAADSSSFARSGGNSGAPSSFSLNSYSTRTYTFGVTNAVTSRLQNEFRLNYTSNFTKATDGLDNFGGAVPYDLAGSQGLPTGSAYIVAFALDFGGVGAELTQAQQTGLQRQWNAVDTAGISFGRHVLKFGVDYRRLSPKQEPWAPNVGLLFFSEQSVQANSIDLGISTNNTSARPVYTNFSSFVQDEWNVTRRLRLSMGLRWEVNPPPGAATGNLPYTIEGSLNDPASIKLAPQGTPLWKTTWANFAPRLGAAYVLRQKTGFETVVRGGGGVFFDTGQQVASWGYNGVGFQAQSLFGGIGFPVPTPVLLPPVVNPPVAPYRNVYAFAPHMQLPYTLQWNAALEQGLGKDQSLSVTYVGSRASRLLRGQELSLGSLNPDFRSVQYFSNGLTSDYDALQAQFKRRLNKGLTALASYTFSHAIDYGSDSNALPYVRGNANFDVRHNAAAALSYDIPGALKEKFARGLLSNWGADARFSIRTGFPVTLAGPLSLDRGTGQEVPAGLNLVAGQPWYLYGTQFPGGRSVNPDAFALPEGCTIYQCSNPVLGDAPRNFIRGFGAWQIDVALRREFPITERSKLQFRAEAFNTFNHPNFGQITATYCSPNPASRAFAPGCTFGQSTQTLASSLGVLSPLYQMGGPRSLQVALKLTF
ncbi:MAG TPA: TonB-dependent receptor [Candidatus Acidoferrum sp.]|nr:TonB-dependent receptor [Candidatus Acidoferrum sp.]